ncbi:glycosyltransferase [Terribacillus saccharophilus]|uniref:glycosyltransferase n=1 Tax=Terribacillus saccharophilus TaxID=361277 RepID=UPI002989A68E|nr:glycosyltransferase [Terribacillus saccharophilus]MCM3225246.1 glycosyltransferase [Terribacillus saccharophilus]
MNHDILFIPWRDWNTIEVEGFRTREAKILLELIEHSKVNKILLVNRSKQPKYISFILKMIGRYYLPSTRKNQQEKTILYKDLFSVLSKVSEKLYILDINYHLPNPKGNKLENNKYIRSLLHKKVNKSLDFLKMKNFITWNFDLTRIESANYLKQDLMLFDAIDNLLEHDQSKNNKEYYAEKYQYANEKSDLIFTVSQSNKIKLFGDQDKVHYIPNGINMSLFSQVIDIKKNLNIANYDKVIGYIGIMQERLDTELLLPTIKAKSNCLFVFVGSVLNVTLFKDIKKCPNVLFTGPINYEEVPAYLKAFDICTIPHKINEFTMSMSPLKLYEYLAAGKEVIMTKVPPYEEFADVVHPVESAEEFIATIEYIENKPYGKFSEKDIEDKIINHSWENRVSLMMNLIAEKKGEYQ